MAFVIGGRRYLGRNAAKNLRRGLYIRRSSPFDYRTGVTRKPQHRPIEKPVPPRGNALTPPPASGIRVFPDRAEHRSHDMIWARYVGTLTMLELFIAFGFGCAVGYAAREMCRTPRPLVMRA